MTPNSTDPAALFTAETTFRVAYQAGKSPVLPLLAAQVGATDALLGLIASVSTLSGLVLKPFAGVAADRFGHRSLLLVALSAAVLLPLIYPLAATAGALVALRLGHGVCTALVGPVVTGWVAAAGGARRAQWLGWFEWPRLGGYVLGPALGGLLLQWLHPAQVYPYLAALSAVALILALRVAPPPSTSPPAAPPNSPNPLLTQCSQVLAVGVQSPALWVAGGCRALLHVGTHAMRAFLPLHALDTGLGVAWAGTLLSLEGGAHLVLSPLGGWAADRLGRQATVSAGLLAAGLGLAVVQICPGLWLAVPVGLLGLAQAFLNPAASAWLADSVPHRHLNAGMGLLGALHNLGKVLGPVLAGLLMRHLSFGTTMALLGSALLIVSAAIVPRRRS